LSAEVLEKYFIHISPANTGTIFPSDNDVESRVMKIILFLVAVYSLIINQCQQKPVVATKMPSGYVQPDYRDRLTEPERSVPYNPIIPKNNGISTASLHYSLASSTMFKK